MINRRQFVALAGSTVVLSACAPGTSAIPGFVAAIQAIGQEAAADVPLLKAAGISVPASLLSYIQDIEQVASGVGAATTAAQGQSVLAQIETYVNDLAPIAVPIITTINPAIGGSLALIAAALPAVEALLNVGVSQLQPIVSQLAGHAPAPTASVSLLAAPTAPTAQDYLAELLRRHA